MNNGGAFFEPQCGWHLMRSSHSIAHTVTVGLAVQHANIPPSSNMRAKIAYSVGHFLHSYDVNNTKYANKQMQ